MIGRFCLIALLTVAASGEAQAATSAETLAACAWERVPTTTRKFSKVGFEFGVPDSERKSAGLLHRIWAACPEEGHVLREKRYSDWVWTSFFSALKKTKPKSVGPDKVTLTVAFCRSYFSDLKTQPASTYWMSNSGSSGREFDRDNFVFWKGMPGSLNEVRLDASGHAIGVPTDDPIGIESYQEGLGSGLAFTLKAGSGQSQCKSVGEDGRLIDA